jgi:hypothetical protein
MGVIRRGLQKLNLIAPEVLSPTFEDPGFKRAEKAMERGDAATATITGIELRLSDGTTERFVRVAVPGLRGSSDAGIQVMAGPMRLLTRLRLGVEVIVRESDGEKVVLDWPAMAARWGTTGELTQKLRRKPPAEGVVDKAVDGGVQRKLKKWTPRRATIVGLARKESPFGPSLNFDVALRLDDGSQAVAARVEIPFYAAWLAAPGAEVPVAVDPGQPGKAVVDWAAAAAEPQHRPGRLDDPPPPGSAAALLAT